MVFAGDWRHRASPMATHIQPLRGMPKLKLTLMAQIRFLLFSLKVYPSSFKLHPSNFFESFRTNILTVVHLVEMNPLDGPIGLVNR